MADQVRRSEMRGAERKGREQADVLVQLATLVKDLALEAHALAPDKASLPAIAERASKLLEQAQRLVP